MPEEFKAGCQRPPVKKMNQETAGTKETRVKEAETMVKVGKLAPDFTAQAFYKGKFVNTGLSEYKGKWVLMCFYPGDFTFV